MRGRPPSRRGRRQRTMRVARCDRARGVKSRFSGRERSAAEGPAPPHSAHGRVPPRRPAAAPWPGKGGRPRSKRNSRSSAHFFGARPGRALAWGPSRRAGPGAAEKGGAAAERGPAAAETRGSTVAETFFPAAAVPSTRSSPPPARPPSSSSSSRASRSSRRAPSPAPRASAPRRPRPAREFWGLGVDRYAADRPQSRGAAADRPRSRGDAAAARPLSRGDAAADRPLSRGDAAADRPSSRGDVAADRPPSRSAPAAASRIVPERRRRGGGSSRARAPKRVSFRR